ncbi:hypothetical protein [Alkalibacterium sp. MB6]|uniref:hypothetical protein n=1 Tax=Alkalibacterium sp. MB6 TaxID=2081965 RepID=UPI0013799A43|nr:hypothetical protein [Alkalibacterium sp. MB6]
MKLTNRVKRLEQIKGNNDTNIFVAWIDGDDVTVSENGEESQMTLAEWEAKKDTLPEAYYIEAVWV